ncbi:MAG: hypothetical protein AAB388_02100 [Patescibacteria group bacterium]
MTHKTPTLAEVDAFAVPDLLANRIVRLHGVPLDFAEGLIKEAKRMLYLAHISDDSVAPSGRVDWAWHEMLMFTRFYKDFAEFIGAFIHHVPNPPPAVDTKEEAWEHIQATLGVPRPGTATYEKTKSHYEKFFNEKPDPLYWP